MYAAKQFSSHLLCYCTSLKQVVRIGTELQPFVQYFYNIVHIVYCCTILYNLVQTGQNLLKHIKIL